jgi:hypothetical protein
MKFPCFLTGTKLENIEVDMEPSDTITTLKKKISELRRVPETHIRVSNGKHPLPEDREVSNWKRFWVELLPGPLKVDVVDSTGSPKTITLDPGENTVWAVKERVYKEEGLHPIMQRLVVNDEEIKTGSLPPETKDVMIMPDDITYSILVKDHLKRLHKVTVQANDVIENIKWSISAHAAPDSLLIFEEKELEDGRTLFDYRIAPNKIVSIRLSARKEYILVTTKDREFTIESHECDRLIDIKETVAMLGLPHSEQRMMFCINPDGTVTYGSVDTVNRT